MVEVESAAVLHDPSTFEARPPTPPRESTKNDKPRSFVLSSFQAKSKRRVSAPASITPNTLIEPLDTPGSESGAKKKVLWADSSEYSEPPTASFDGRNITHAVRRLQPSSERKPTKSILKAHNGEQEQDHNGLGSSTRLPPLHHHATFATMLESITQELAGKERSSKMDAYLMLSSSLKASDTVPDLKALKAKMGVLCQFILQDLTQKLDNGKGDTGLIVSALVLLSSFLQKPVITETFPPEFPGQVVEHAIKAFEDTTTTKEILKHLMFLMAQQNFPPKTMTQERVGRVITALHNIEDHIKGKSIAVSRINISRTLLRQSKSHMLATTSWVQDLFNDMLSSIKEIRLAAITFGFESATTLGAESNATRAVTSLFKLDAGEQGTFADFYSGRLKVMVKGKDKEDAAAVPQIWSILILFLRAKAQTLEQWSSLTTFLEVIQLCLNSSDMLTRTEANFAWTRLIFVVQPTERTSAKFRALLSQPLFTQLKGRKSQLSRKQSLSSVCMLLYYALRPQSSSTRLDLYWDEYVVPFVAACLASAKGRDVQTAKQDAADACHVIQCLFDSTTQRKWSEIRGIDSLQHKGMDASELPAIESKWLRKNHTRVFFMLVPLMEKMYLDLGTESAITGVWIAYITSIASPAVMEVKVSIDTMASIASIFSMLHNFWNVGKDKLGCFPLPVEIWSGDRTAAFLRSFQSVVLSTIKGLGLQPFAEKQLSINQDTFIAVATPSQQPRKIRVEVRSPLHHLVLLLLNPSPGLVYDDLFHNMVRCILHPFFEARPSSKSKMEFVHNLTHLLPLDPTEPSRKIWQVLATFATTAVDTRDITQNSGSDELPLGHSYRDLVRILGTGIKFFPSGPTREWTTLFDAVATSATIDAGDAGRAVILIEPLAKLCTRDNGAQLNGISYCKSIVGKATYPKDRHALDAANRRLWGAGFAGLRTASFDPYVQLYEYVRATLEITYAAYSKDNLRTYVDLITATTLLPDRCPLPLLLPLLAKIQLGIQCWIVDGDRKLVGGDGLSKAVLVLWGMIKKSITRLFEQHSHLGVLSDLETLICAGLSSVHRSIANSAIDFCTSSFGPAEECLEYPKRVKEVLLSLTSNAHIKLPSLPKTFDANETSVKERQLMHYEESQDDAYDVSSFPNDSAIMRIMRQSTPQVVIDVGRSSSLKRSREDTPNTSNRKSRKRDVTPRLRHDDSQVQFEAIESSPMADRVLDSQLLTDKQKEARERQNADQAMFPDLRSSPQPRSSKRITATELELPTYRSSSQLGGKAFIETVRQTTPSLVLPSDDDGFVASSPTPTRSLRETTEIVDPPSSPPEAARRDRLPYDENISSSPPEGTPEPMVQSMPSANLSTDEAELADAVRPSSSAGIGEPINAAAVSSGPQDVSSDNLDDQKDTGSGVATSELPNGIISFGPSAQVDPFRFEHNQTLSTIAFTPEERQSSPDEDAPSQQLRATVMEQEAALPSAEAEDTKEVLSSSLPVRPAGLNLQLETRTLFDPKPPTTPSPHASSSPIGQKTPQFVDARSSPALSDRAALGEDIFEDAISSPRLNLRWRKSRISSTPDGSGDDSSFLRAVAPYDHEPEKHVSWVAEQEDRPRTWSSLANEAVGTESSLKAPHTSKLARRKTSKIQESVHDDKDITSPVQCDASLYGPRQPPTSSMPSLIPETPGVKAAAPAQQQYFHDDGTPVNMDETIDVDTSSLETNYPVANSRQNKGKKRLQHVAVAGEVPYSQDAIVASQETSPRKRRSPMKNDWSPAKKRRGRGRPRGSFGPARKSAELSDVGSSQDARNKSMSVDLDASMQGVGNDTFENSFASSAKEPNESQDVEEAEVEMQTALENGIGVKPTIEESVMAGKDTTNEGEDDDEPARVETNGEDTSMVVVGVEQEDHTGVEVNEETTIDETRYDETLLDQPENHTIEEDVPGPIANIPVAVEPAAREILEQAPKEEAARGPEAGTLESMMSKLSGLMSELNTAALTRLEVHKLEDMFMDAKRQLYDAERRGRESTDT